MAFIIIDLEFNNLSEIHKYYPNIYKDIPNLKELDLIRCKGSYSRVTI